MKLIGSPASPFTRKVRVVLAEKRIDYEFVVDPPNHPSTQVPAYNPLGKIPVLITDDGATIFDSRVIVEYLDSASPVARLIPDEIRQRIQVRRWEALADGCTDATVAVVAEKRRAASQQLPNVIERQQGKIDRALVMMAEELGARNWCSGDSYNLSDIAVGCSLGYLDLRLPELNWRKAYPNLARLTERLVQRPSFRDTAPPSA
ncbi:MAG TPA: glutathione S-transferase [Burkholderiales bacterium]|nr:glutathione S-transferase [Burkholderiales bacterium]